jgi:hypothetical protein
MGERKINLYYYVQDHYLNDEGKIKKDKFIKKHYELSCKSTIEYIFYHSDIGDCLKIKCGKCKKFVNLTNYDDW